LCNLCSAWKFYNTPAEGEPGGDSWGKVPTEKRIASAWGLPGSYDPERKLLYWGISKGIDPLTGGPAEFQARLETDRAAWMPIIRDLGITLD
jgi:hypothetical protein